MNAATATVQHRPPAWRNITGGLALLGVASVPALGLGLATGGGERASTEHPGSGDFVRRMALIGGITSGALLATSLVSKSHPLRGFSALGTVLSGATLLGSFAAEQFTGRGGVRDSAPPPGTAETYTQGTDAFAPRPEGALTGPARWWPTGVGAGLVFGGALFGMHTHSKYAYAWETPVALGMTTLGAAAAGVANFGIGYGQSSAPAMNLSTRALEVPTKITPVPAPEVSSDIVPPGTELATVTTAMDGAEAGRLIAGHPMFGGAAFADLDAAAEATTGLTYTAWTEGGMALPPAFALVDTPEGVVVIGLADSFEPEDALDLVDSSADQRTQVLTSEGSVVGFVRNNEVLVPNPASGYVTVMRSYGDDDRKDFAAEAAASGLISPTETMGDGSGTTTIADVLVRHGATEYLSLDEADIDTVYEDTGGAMAALIASGRDGAVVGIGSGAVIADLDLPSAMRATDGSVTITGLVANTQSPLAEVIVLDGEPYIAHEGWWVKPENADEIIAAAHALAG